MPDDLQMPTSPDGQWTVEGSSSGLTIMAQDGTVKTRATFAGEEHIPMVWAPDSSIFTISFIGDYDPRHHRFDHLGLVGIDGHVTRVDVPGGIDFVPRIFEWLRATCLSAGRLTVHASRRTARSWAAMAG